MLVLDWPPQCCKEKKCEPASWIILGELFPLHILGGLDMFIPRVSAHRAVQRFSLPKNDVSVLQPWGFFRFPNSIFPEKLMFAASQPAILMSAVHLLPGWMKPIPSVCTFFSHLLHLIGAWPLSCDFCFDHCFFLLSHYCTMHCEMLIGLEVTICIIKYFLFCVVII